MDQLSHSFEEGNTYIVHRACPLLTWFSLSPLYLAFLALPTMYPSLYHMLLHHMLCCLLCDHQAEEDQPLVDELLTEASRRGAGMDAGARPFLRCSVTNRIGIACVASRSCLHKECTTAHMRSGRSMLVLLHVRLAIMSIATHSKRGMCAFSHTNNLHPPTNSTLARTHAISSHNTVHVSTPQRRTSATRSESVQRASSACCWATWQPSPPTRCDLQPGCCWPARCWASAFSLKLRMQ